MPRGLSLVESFGGARPGNCEACVVRPRVVGRDKIGSISLGSQEISITTPTGDVKRPHFNHSMYGIWKVLPGCPEGKTRASPI